MQQVWVRLLQPAQDGQQGGMESHALHKKPSRTEAVAEEIYQKGLELARAAYSK